MNRNLTKTFSRFQSQRFFKRSFWTINKGTATGYIESIRNKGLFFKHIDISTRVTSSNLAKGHMMALSASKYDLENKIEPIAREAMEKRLPVKFSYECDFVGNPRVGYTLMLGGATFNEGDTSLGYITDISIDKDLIDMKVKS